MYGPVGLHFTIAIMVMVTSSSVLALAVLPRVACNCCALRHCCAFALINFNTCPSNHVASHLPSVPVWVVFFVSSSNRQCDAGPKLLRYSATPASMRTYYILISPRSSAPIVNHVFLDRSPQLASSLMTWTVGLMNEFWCARSPGPGSELAGRTDTLPDYRHA